jgi:hypothetical protein
LIERSRRRINIAKLGRMLGRLESLDFDRMAEDRKGGGADFFDIPPLNAEYRVPSFFLSPYIFVQLRGRYWLNDKVPRVIMYSFARRWRYSEREKVQIKASKHGFNAYLYFAKCRHYAVLRPLIVG